jgi:hypothetical protein
MHIPAISIYVRLSLFLTVGESDKKHFDRHSDNQHSVQCIYCTSTAQKWCTR